MSFAAGGAFPPTLIPAAKKQALETNYLKFNDGAGAGNTDTFAQQYLPELYEAEIERYGNRTLQGFLRMVGAEMPMSSDQVIWTDANEHNYLEEAGTMNIFFRINDTLITAPTTDTILDGVTRKSLIQIARDIGIDVEIKKLKVDELKNAAKNGSLKEIFGAGTAAVVSQINAFQHKGELFELNELDNSYAEKLKSNLVGIQTNQLADHHSWRYKV